MNFLHPGLLIAGALAVSIPIIIHLLFRQRRRPVPWAAMRFLIEAYRKRRRRLKLEHLILLLVRCLIIACLALALGRPLLDASGLFGASGRDVYLLVDNSVASGLRLSSGETALEGHKRTARDMLGALGAGDRAGLVTLGSPAEPVVVPASSDLGAVERLIEQLEATDGASDLQGALGALASHLESIEGDDDPRPTVGVVLSELRAGSADVSRPLTGSLAGLEGVRLLASNPAVTGVGNVQVVSVDPLRSVVLTGAGRAAEDVSVRVRLARTGEAVGAAQTTTVRLRATAPERLDDASASDSRATVRWTPGQSEAIATLTVRLDRAGEEGAGASVLVASIDRDALEADNVRRTPVRITDALEVGIVGTRRFSAGASAAQRPAADWLRPALAPTDSTPVRLTDLEPGALDAPTLTGLDALFIAQPDLVPDDAWAALRAFTDGGGMLVVMPPAEATVHLWTDAFTEAFDLEWTFPREAVEAPGGDVFTIAPRGGDTGGGEAGGGGGGGVLTLLADELEPLVRPVGVFKTLPPDLGTGASTARILNLDDGTAWLVGTRPGARVREAGAGQNGDDPPPGRGVDNSRSGRGLLFYLASAPTLTWTDLPARPLMVPLAQELVRQGVGNAASGYAQIAGRPVAAPGGATSLARLSSETGTRALDVDSSGLVTAPIRDAGVWRALDRAGRTQGVVAINPDTRGARTDVNDPEAVSAWLGEAFGPADDLAERLRYLDPASPASSLEAGGRGSPFSLPLLIAALTLALVETGLARWFAHAWRDPNLTGGTA